MLIKTIVLKKNPLYIVSHQNIQVKFKSILFVQSILYTINCVCLKSVGSSFERTQCKCLLSPLHKFDTACLCEYIYLSLYFMFFIVINKVTFLVLDTNENVIIIIITSYWINNIIFCRAVTCCAVLNQTIVIQA